MKLYSVQNGVLIKASIVRETKLYYFVDNARLNSWSRRVEKSMVAVATLVGGQVATTPRMAWQIEQERAQQYETRTTQLAIEARARQTIAAQAIEAIDNVPSPDA